MSGQELTTCVVDARQAVIDAYNQWRISSQEAAKAEAAYQAAKAARYVELKAETRSATDAANRVKGDVQVNNYLMDRDCKAALADADKELIQIRKLDLRCLEAQYEREWSLAGKDMM